jgi:hypothetical protein
LEIFLGESNQWAHCSDFDLKFINKELRINNLKKFKRRELIAY